MHKLINSPEERLNKNNSKHKVFTGSASDWVIVREESLPTQTEALKREKQFKSWKSRERIAALVINNIPGKDI